MRRIRKLSTIAMIALLPMTIYYLYDGLSWNLELSFLDPYRWVRNDRWVDPSAEIAMRTRIVFFIIWLIPTVAGTISYLFAFSMLILLRRGVVFDQRIAGRLTWMGALTSFSGFSAVFAGSVSPMIRSWHNADGPLPLRLWLDTGNIGFGFCGLAFIFLGLVMREAIRIARENEEFV